MAKVLLVEDDSVLAEMYKAKFEQEGHTVRVALGSDECMRIITEFEPELILLDILMPKLNGFHVLKEIKKRPDTHDTPVVLLTNLDQAETEVSKEMTDAIGVSDYLVKGRHTPEEVVAKSVKHLKK